MSLDAESGETTDDINHFRLFGICFRWMCDAGLNAREAHGARRTIDSRHHNNLHSFISMGDMNRSSAEHFVFSEHQGSAPNEVLWPFPGGQLITNGSDFVRLQTSKTFPI